jgi:hypothetical protein
VEAHSGACRAAGPGNLLVTAFPGDEVARVIEFIELIFVIWGLFLLPALPVCGAVWMMGRKRVTWNLFDFSLLIVPYAVWLDLLCVNLRQKSMANIGEAFYVGAVVALAPLIRLVLPKKWGERVVAATLLIAACVMAAAIYIAVPCLPE